MKPRRRQSLIVACDGVASLEFALAGGIFLVLILFIIQASLLLWTKSAMQDSASRTARCMAIASSDCTDPQAYAISLLKNWGVSGIVSSDVNPKLDTTCSNTAGHFSMVTISSAAPSFFVPHLANVTLSSSACYPSAT